MTQLKPGEYNAVYVGRDCPHCGKLQMFMSVTGWNYPVWLSALGDCLCLVDRNAYNKAIREAKEYIQTTGTNNDSQSCGVH